MGWRRALCTSVRRDPHPTKQQQQQHGNNSNSTYGSSSPSPSPRSCGKLSFFSTAGNLPPPPPPPPSASAPTTPALRCRTKPAPPPHAKCQHQPETVVSSRTPAPATPKKRLALLQALSAPSSPRSPSRFQLLKASLLLTKTRCGICAHSISKNGGGGGGGGGAVFTGECSHSFHFPCIAAHVRSSSDAPSCPVCSTPWRHPPPFLRLPPSSSSSSKPIDDNAENRSPHKARTAGGRGGAPEDDGRKNKVYDDDEPLLPSKAASAGGFNPIPEADEDDGGDDDTEGGEEFRGFFPDPTAAASCPRARGGLAVSVMPEAALVSSGPRHGKYVVAVRVKAPGVRSSASARRAPIDLVTVLDVSQGMTGEKLQMLKRGMRLVIASLGPADRLSIVAFSGAAKRLQPLRRMSRQGQRSARQIVDRLVVCAAAQGQDQAQGTCVGDALRKATKVLEDRRERNPVATIMLLSDTQQQQQPQQGDHHIQQPRGADHRRPPSAPTRFTHVEIPIGSGDEPLMRSPLMPKAEQGQPQPPSAPPLPVEDAFAKCLGGLVSVVMQDVHLQLVFPSGEISAVYSCGPGQRAAALGGGGGGGGAAVTVRLGEMYAEEERELLVELRAPLHRQHHHPHSLSVRCSYRDPASQDAVCGAEQPLLLPPLHSGSTSQRLRDLFVATRAVAESRRLAELGDYATALHLLSSARTLLLQSRPAQPQDLIGSLDTELSDMHWRRSQQQQQPPPPPLTPTLRTRREVAAPGPGGGAGGEPLTPTSAWRAAEQLAKVAIMRKSMNRVSDLHGFENARF